MKYSRLLLLAIVYLLGQLDIARAAIVPDGDVVPGPETAPWPWGSYTTGYVGQNGHGSLLVNEGGHLYSGDGIIAKANSATGEVTVSGAGSTWENTYGIYVGSFGNGRLAIADGALVTVGSNLAVGEHGNSSSEMIVSGGGDVVIAGSLEGGRYETSQGRITVNGAGSTIETGYMFLGLNGSSVGTLRVESEGLVSVAHDVVLGETATGQAMILSGADATVDGTTKIGLQAGSHGGLTVDGAGSTWTNTYLYVGYAGSGTVAVTNGGTVSNYSCFLGDQPGGAGAVTVNGADSTWTVAGDAWIGHSGGSGTVTVADGGSATALGLHIWRGTLAVGQGGSVSVTSTDAVDVTDEGRIEMDGGTLSTAGVLRLDGDHAALTGHGVVNGALWGNCLLGTGVTASGGKLVVGDATRADGVDFTGPVTVGDNATLELVDADAARAPSVTLDNGVLVARNGIGALFRRNLCGVVVGNGSITMPQLTGTVDMTQAVDVGTSLARVYSVDTPTFGGSVTLDGGRMVSPHGLTISVSGSLSGWGTIETLLGSTAADPGELVVRDGEVILDGGTISAISLLRLNGDYAALTGHGTVNSALWGYCPYGEGLTASGGKLVVGDAARTDGVWFSGPVTVADNATLELADADHAYLAEITLDNGVLIARNGVDLDFAPGGYGVVVGDAQHLPSPTGTVNLTQALDVGASVAEVYSASRPTFGGSVTLDGGRLVSSNGLTISTGGRFSGCGVIEAFGGGGGDYPGYITLRDVDVTLEGGSISAADSALVSGSTLRGYGTIEGRLVDEAAVEVAGGTLTCTRIIVSESGDAHGTVSVIGADAVLSLSADGWSSVGYGGTGTLAIEDGGAVHAHGALSIGTWGGSNGDATVTGTGSMLIGSCEINVGEHGTGRIEVTGGGSVSAAGMSVGNNSGAGTVTVGGNESSLSVANGWLQIGRSGTGTIRVEDGGTLHAADTSYFVVGSSANSDGELVVTGDGSTAAIVCGGTLGAEGTGSLTVADGGSMTIRGLSIGNDLGGHGDATVTGTGSTLAMSDGEGMAIGARGVGLLTIGSGGAVMAANVWIALVVRRLGHAAPRWWHTRRKRWNHQRRSRRTD